MVKVVVPPGVTTEAGLVVTRKSAGLAPSLVMVSPVRLLEPGLPMVNVKIPGVFAVETKLRLPPLGRSVPAGCCTLMPGGATNQGALGIPLANTVTQNWPAPIN